MADNNIPYNDDDFDKLQSQLIGAVSTNPAKFGVTTEDVTALQTAQQIWAIAYPAHLKAQSDAATATSQKGVARSTLETVVRSVAKKINATATVDNALRAEAGLAARNGTRSTIGAPDTRPLGRIESQGHHTLVLHFVDEETPTRTAKPEGVQGCQI